jgi:1,4-alpha-glucan branching enzyme
MTQSTQNSTGNEPENSPNKSRGEAITAGRSNEPKKDERQIKYEEKHFIDTNQRVWNYSLLTDEDVANYQNGTNYRLYEKFGSHSIQVNAVWGMYFCVWAPNATSVSVKGNFNDWKNDSHELYPRWDKSGIWEGFIPHLGWGEVYKYHIHRL